MVTETLVLLPLRLPTAMAAAGRFSGGLYHTVHPTTPYTSLHCLHVLLYSAAILAALHHRATSLPTTPYPIPTSLLLLADLVLAFHYLTSLPFRWNPVRRTERPDLLPLASLPSLDIFICTADPYKEPPVAVASTALSVLAYDYPARRLSVYVSDDGGSEMTLFAFMEAARFAKHWLPFCEENGVERRSPEAYFGSDDGRRSDGEVKIIYETMKRRIESVVEKGYVSENLLKSEEDRELFKKWKGYTRRDHPSIIQVLLESGKDTDVKGNEMPNLVYVSREKRETISHNFKAGALNTLIRVSSTMTNATVILTLDCDMYSNDPRAPYRVMCYMMDPILASGRLAFIQFPQKYQGINKHDIYGGEVKRVFTINARAMDGLKGPNYVGTGCFFSRRAFYGPPTSSLLEHHDLTQERTSSISSEAILKQAYEVSSCAYELGTKWGSKIGLRYGSLVEDYYSGYLLHCEGWESVFCDPKRPAFLGDTPKKLSDALDQVKRWAVGLYEVAFSRHSPVIYGTRRASVLVGLAYGHYSLWGISCIPISTYSIVPQLALIHGISLFPKLSDTWFYLYAYLFLAAYGQDLMDFLAAEGTFWKWWNDQRMWMIRSLTSFIFATSQYVLKQLGISVQGFNVTSKVGEDEQNELYDRGLFDFSMVSPFFVSLGAVAIVNLVSFIVGFWRVTRKEGMVDATFIHLFLSGFGVANCWPIYEAMLLRRDRGRMPGLVTGISSLVAGLLLLIGPFMFIA